MTVTELIQHLQDCDPDAVVVASCGETERDIAEVLHLGALYVQIGLV